MSKEVKVQKAINYKFVSLGGEQADKSIKSVATRGKALKVTSHEVAVGLLMHWHEHGNSTKLVPFADAVKVAFTGNARTAFIDWVQVNTSLTWDAKTSKFTHVKGADREFNESEAKVTPFFEFVKDNAKPFDFNAAIASLLKRADKAANEGNAKPEQVKALHAFAKAQGIIEVETE